MRAAHRPPRRRRRDRGREGRASRSRRSRPSTSSSEIGGRSRPAKTACTARAARTRTRSTSSSATGSIPPSTCQSRWTREPLVDVVGIEVAAAEGVVVTGHDRVARRDEVGAGQQLTHQLRRLTDRRVRRRSRRCPTRPPDRATRRARSRRESPACRPEPRARARRTRSTRSGRPATPPRARPRRSVRREEHRQPLRGPHQRLRAGAGREAHLHAARRVRRAEERLRPGRVVAVDEHRLGAVDGERLGVGDEAADRELEVASLLNRALRHHAGATGLRADENRERVQRRVARDADRRLDLGEPAAGGLGRVGGEQRRALLQIGDVRLVARVSARAQLPKREHQLHGVEQPDHARELRRRQAARQPARARRAGRRCRRAPARAPSR